VTARRSNYGKARAKATSEGALLAEGELSFALVDRERLGSLNDRP